MSDYSKHITNKFTCKKCQYNKMYPNSNGEKVKGYKCAICGTVNYPVRDSLRENGDDIWLTKLQY